MFTFPILAISAISNVYKLSEFQLSDIRASTGLALSWLTPVGPIGLHLSKPLLKKSGDSLETFSFQLGTSF